MVKIHLDSGNELELEFEDGHSAYECIKEYISCGEEVMDLTSPEKGEANIFLVLSHVECVEFCKDGGDDEDED